MLSFMISHDDRLTYSRDILRRSDPGHIPVQPVRPGMTHTYIAREYNNFPTFCRLVVCGCTPVYE